MKNHISLQLVLLLVSIAISQTLFAADDAITLKEVTEKEEKAEQLRNTAEEVTQQQVARVRLQQNKGVHPGPPALWLHRRMGFSGPVRNPQRPVAI